MSAQPKLFALVAALLVVAGAAGPAMAAASAPAAAGNLAVDVSQDAGGAVLIAATDDGAPADGANITVEALEGNYTDEGTYTDVADGNLTLAEPGEVVNVSVTVEYEGETATVEARIAPVEDDDGTFGQAVQEFIRQLREDADSNVFGAVVANWVVEHNPGNAPDHAGPPAWLTDDEGDGDSEKGPPDHAGPPDDAEDGEDGEKGPPDHAGPPDDKGSDDGDDDDGDDDEDDDEDDGDEDDGSDE